MNNVITFVLAHEVVFAALGVAILDFLFALAPGINANGIVHWFYLTLQGLAAKK